MKKCGILTINVDLMNYGNRLQNYAMLTVLQKLGYDAETINYIPVYPYEQSIEKQKKFLWDKIKSFISRLLRFVSNSIRYRRLGNYRNRKKFEDKRRKWQRFLANRIKFSKHKYSIDSDLTSLNELYDLFICGSDQVWNPYWEGTQPIYFMQFASPEKRIAYAASFGVSRIPAEDQEKYARALKNIKHISCRENEGVAIIESLGVTNVHRVLDPTLLLDDEKFTKIEEKPKTKLISQKYLLAYFLGDIDTENYSKIKEFASAYNLSIIWLDRMSENNSLFCDPSEFIYLVHHAELICTDSFHGMVFSIIYKRPFISFIRQEKSSPKGYDMSSRIISLFNVLGIHGRNSTEITLDNVFDMDYSKVYIRLMTEREKSFDFLKRALRGV